MRTSNVLGLGCLALGTLFLLSLVPTPVDCAPVGSKTYIISMTMNATHLDVMAKRAWYTELMDGAKTVLAHDHPDDGMDCLHHVYHHAFNGFSARLTDKQAAYMKTLPCVLRVSPDRIHYGYTTRSPDFVGLTGKDSHLWQDSNYGDDVIIGVLDTGIWPERMSFDDTGLGPIRAEWQGVCQSGPSFTAANCNNKIIGARFYATNLPQDVNKDEYLSPRDYNGHGTHTASTAAGRPVSGASVNGAANGTARGMAPNARIAVYKVLWDVGEGRAGGSTSDIVAAYEDAINDGVNIISASLGSEVNNITGIEEIFDRDEAEVIAAYRAVKRGIFVSVSGGNDGSKEGTISNVAPWYTTVASTTQDRVVRDGRTLYGTVPAPKVAWTSSRGPILSARGQWLKPDIAAPGVQILAAGIKEDLFAFMSGTSMACPHVSGFAALLRSLHRDWSPAAIKSALMTTATTLDPRNNPITTQEAPSNPASPWALGAGFALPERAMNPGLVYDMSSNDYLLFMCGLGYDSATIQKIDPVAMMNCPVNPTARIQDANLPSFVANFRNIASLSSVPPPSMSFARILTNVEDAGIERLYKATVNQPTRFRISIEPSTLTFTSAAATQPFTLRVAPLGSFTFQDGDQSFGRVTWSDGVHNVSSPVVVMVGTSFDPPAEN
ncbi:hypothetical protein KC19_5G200000 [Ceratodon purpureus]|uniref:Subtilisin-like protease n=1 Tax=Ceratodon purpureus TaxID=3225 RepID=A0A8T0I4P7_CERPU|nr:hypothetical protein KC19_5G200000 [Ceratodon purpureus]